MNRIFQMLFIVLLGLYSLNVHASRYSEGAVTKTNFAFPADDSKSIEFTFTLDNGEDFIMYTREVIILMPEQVIRVEKSDVKGKGSRFVVCSIVFTKLVFAAKDGKKQFIKLDAPTIHKAEKGMGC